MRQLGSASAFVSFCPNRECFHRCPPFPIDIALFMRYIEKRKGKFDMFQDNRISNSDIQQKTTLDKKIKPLNLDREHMKQNIIQNKVENDIYSDRRKTEVRQL